MTLLLILIIALLGVGIVAAISNIMTPKSSSDVEDYVRPSDCCGAHEVCERDSLRPHPDEAIVYFEDEELDRFSSIGSELYTDDIIMEFQDVFDTLRSDEVAAWCRSLQLRGIVIPEDIKEQILFVICENRSTQ